MKTQHFDCATARMYLSTRHDREPLDCESGSLDSHLATCADCREFEGRLAELTPLFGTLRELAPPPDLAGRLLARAGKSEGSSPSRFSLTRTPPRSMSSPAHWMPRAAAGLVGFLSIFAMGRTGPQDPAAPDAHFPLDQFARAGRAFQESSEFRALPERELMLHVSQAIGDRR